VTARWPAWETTAWFSERKQQWHVTALTELPCRHNVSAQRKHADKRTATTEAVRVLRDKVRQHGTHTKG
jgi:hypothetical protein